MAKKEEVQPGGWRDVCGVAAIAVGILLFLSLISYNPNDIGLFSSPPNDPPHNFVGLMGSWFGFFGIMGFGAASYVLPLVLLISGSLVMFKYPGRVSPKFGLLLACTITFGCLLELMPDLLRAWVEKNNAYGPGGVLGHILGGQVLMGLLGEIGAAIVLAAIMLGLLVVLFEVHPLQVFGQLGGFMAGAGAWLGSKVEASRAAREALRDEDVELEKSRERLRKAVKPAAPEVEAAPPAPSMHSRWIPVLGA